MSTPTPLRTVEQAIDHLVGNTRIAVGNETVATIDALGRILAEDIVSDMDVPPQDNSAMDGYTFASEDCPENGTIMAISQKVSAGHPPSPLAPGTAARILTGGEIPAGADTVQIQENCVADGSAVEILKAPATGANIRKRGQDITSGATLVARGTRLRPQDLGVIASIGVARVRVYRPLTIALVSSGDELVEPGTTLAPGQIYNSNRFTLQALLTSLGINTIYSGVARDTLEETRKTLAHAAENADAVISAGGVSVGDEDHVRPAVAALGQIDMWKIAIKPGKPLAFGTIAETPFMGLPGNPVSVFVTFLVLARPWLLKMQGCQDLVPATIPVTARFSRPTGERAEYLRARLTDQGAEIFSQLSSGVLTSTSWSNGLVVHPVGEPIEPGQVVQFIPYERMLR